MQLSRTAALLFPTANTFELVPVDIKIRDDARYVFQGSWPAFELLLPPKYQTQHNNMNALARVRGEGA